ncbi:MAG: DUF3347 domain-containing protein [Cyclobacteriaceae bacterium]
MKKQFVSVALSLSFIVFGAQAQNHHQKDHEDHAEMSVSHDVPLEFQQQLAEVYEASLDLKEAFVASEASQVKDAVPSVRKALSNVDMALLKDKAHMTWMDQLKPLDSSLAAIGNSEALDIQRKSFAAFNEALYQSIKAFGMAGKGAYYQYCPMANNNQGAYWLSDSEEIRNPYFGNKMPNCGSIKEVIN